MPLPDIYYNHVDRVMNQDTTSPIENPGDGEPSGRMSAPPFHASNHHPVKRSPFAIKTSKFKKDASRASVESTGSLIIYSPLIRLIKSSVYVIDVHHGLCILSLDDLTCRYQMGNHSAPPLWVQWCLNEGLFNVGYADGLIYKWRLNAGTGHLEDTLFGDVMVPPSDVDNPVMLYVVTVALLYTYRYNII